MTEPLRDRIRGALLGAAIGDALGAPWEFKKASALKTVNITKGGYKKGVFGTAPGTPTDDSTLVRLHAEALLDDSYTLRGYQTAYMNRMTAWAFSNPPDIGAQTHRAANAWKASGKAPRASEAASGNGSLMAVAPAALIATSDEDAARRGESFATFTHPSSMAKFVNRQYSAAMWRASRGGVSGAMVHRISFPVGEVVDGAHIGWCAIAAALAFECLDSVILGLNTPFEVLVNVVRQGGDTDTNACVTGALIGAAYGLQAWTNTYNAPSWLLGDLGGYEEWCTLADSLYDLSQKG